MKKKLLTFFILCLFCTQYLLSSETAGDSIAKTSPFSPVEYKANLKDFILPVALISTGIVASQTNYKDIFPFERSNYKSNDNPWEYIFLGGVASSMFVFDRYVKASHKPFDQSLLLLGSAGLSIIPAYILKENYKEQRPDGGWNSFPSGHATTSFMIAHVLYKEFKDSNAWLAYGGYVIAAGITGSRIIQNKHWLCDGLAGAGIGILGTELAYWLYFPVRNFIAAKINPVWSENASLVPEIDTQALCLNLSIRF
jgi:membrane-associated phospholipid phosphatase